LAAILKMADISKILKTQNCSSNGDLSLCQILCLYHYPFRSNRLIIVIIKSPKQSLGDLLFLLRFLLLLLLLLLSLPNNFLLLFLFSLLLFLFFFSFLSADHELEHSINIFSMAANYYHWVDVTGGGHQLWYWFGRRQV
jgi:hypothetical protein